MNVKIDFGGFLKRNDAYDDFVRLVKGNGAYADFEEYIAKVRPSAYFTHAFLWNQGDYEKWSLLDSVWTTELERALVRRRRIMRLASALDDEV